LGPIRASINLSPGDATALTFAPDQTKAVSDRDLVTLASWAGKPERDVKLADFLLAHFARDGAASTKAVGVEEDLVAHFGVTPAAPAPASPTSEPKEGLAATIDWKGSRELGTKDRSRLRFRTERDVEAAVGQTGKIRFGEEREADFVVTAVKGDQISAHVPDEAHKDLKKGEGVRILLDPAKPGPSAETAKGLDAHRRKLEGILEAALRDPTDSNLDKLYGEFNEHARQRTSRRDLGRLAQTGRWLGNFGGLGSAKPQGERRFEYEARYQWVTMTAVMEIDPEGKIQEFQIEGPRDWGGPGGGGGGGPGGWGPGGWGPGGGGGGGGGRRP
jgi:hypothetical protein